MPSVHVYYQIDMTHPVADSIRRSVQKFGAGQLSWPKRPLLTTDFFPMFHKAEEFDGHNKYDITIEIRLDRDQVPEADLTQLGELLSQYVAGRLSDVYSGAEITVGAELDLVKKGWGEFSISLPSPYDPGRFAQSPREHRGGDDDDMTPVQ